MSHAAVAKRYAQAIFELGVETSGLAGLVEDIRKVAESYASSREMRSIADNPLVPEADRLAVVDEIATRLGLSPLAHNAVGLLARRKRMTALPEIARALSRMADERAGIIRVTVVSAKPLADAYAQRLEHELETITGKKIAMDRRHDPELLTGVVVRIGDRVIDGSARATLLELRSQLLSAK
jgi:F-type H+-transporting ATPase subunit delta